MQPFPQTVIVRHRRENLKKCSLHGLESRNDLLFFSYPGAISFDLNSYILLTLDAEPLSLLDRDKGILIIDGTWRYAEKMTHFVNNSFSLIKRSLPPHFRTAYPRKQDDCSDPERGLASIEALYLAYYLLERDTESLLDSYYWKEEFLRKNF